MASESEDEELKAAIAMSLASHESHTNSLAADELSLSRNKQDSESKTVALTGLFGLDRKAMEQERLARLSGQKRERSISPPTRSRKAPRLAENTTNLPSGARLKMFSALVQEDQHSRKSENANAANKHLKSEPVEEIKVKSEMDDFKTEQLPTGAVKYHNGVVKKTWAFGHPRTGSDVKIEEVLEAPTLRVAVLSAFQWDVDWVLSKLKTPLKGGKTKCVFVMHAKEAELRQQMLNETHDHRHFLRLCFPPMDGMIYCMHSKLMLLFHPEKLRIAVPTANLLNFDWGETGVMENSVFMIDRPRLPEGSKTQIEELTFFGKELLHFIDKQGLEQNVKDNFLSFDFSATTNMAFVHTIGGISFRDEAERTGLPGLGRAVRQLGLETNHLEVDFAASSIGSLNEPYLQKFHAAVSGNDMIKDASAVATKAKADFFKSIAVQSAAAERPIGEKLRIYFPTYDIVRASKAGCAGTICIARNYWESKTFPRTCFRNYKSTRSGLLSHNKILVARGKSRKDGDSSKSSRQGVAWVYVGSANMSKSAWGEVVNDKRYKDWKVSARNWECGVLLPVSVVQPAQPVQVDMDIKIKAEKREGEDSETESEEETTAKKPVKVKLEEVDGEDAETESEDKGKAIDSEKLVDMSAFKNVIDLPFEVPGARYAPGQRPWYFKEDF